MKARLRVRIATMADAACLLEWRNDPLTRMASRHQSEIGSVEHDAWLAKILRDESCVLLIGVMDAERVGTVRFTDSEYAGEWAREVSITLAPSARGRGIARLLLAAGEDYVTATKSRRPLLAFVRKDNMTSRNLFTRAEYEVVQEDAIGVWFAKAPR